MAAFLGEKWSRREGLHLQPLLQKSAHCQWAAQGVLDASRYQGTMACLLMFVNGLHY
jgi:hypothetical protein